MACSGFFNFIIMTYLFLAILAVALYAGAAIGNKILFLLLEPEAPLPALNFWLTHFLMLAFSSWALYAVNNGQSYELALGFLVLSIAVFMGQMLKIRQILIQLAQK